MNTETTTPREESRYIQHYRAHLQAVIQCALEVLSIVKFDKNHPQHLAAICLYSTIFQSATECHRLLAGPTVTVPGIMRSILESYADLCAVIRDVGHAKNMLATLHEEQRKHLEDMIRSPANPFHADVARHIDPGTKLVEIQADLDGLRSAGHYPLTVFDRFAAADLGDLYRTIYWQLGLEAHNNIVALERRHIRREGDQFEIDIFSENTSSQLVMYYDSLTAIFIDSSRKLYDLVNFSMPIELGKQIDAFDRFRAEAVAAFRR